MDEATKQRHENKQWMNTLIVILANVGIKKFESCNLVRTVSVVGGKVILSITGGSLIYDHMLEFEKAVIDRIECTDTEQVLNTFENLHEMETRVDEIIDSMTHTPVSFVPTEWIKSTKLCVFDMVKYEHVEEPANG